MAPQAGIHYAEETPAPLGHVSVALPKFRDVFLHCLSDVHIAADRHQRKALDARLRRVKEGGPSHRLILHGDWMDYCNKTGKSFRHGAMSPQAELDEVVKILAPFASQIDLMLNGNHEFRSERESGLDAMATIAARIGCARAYRRGPSVVRYSYHKSTGNHGSCRFHAEILVHHGFGGGTPGAASNNIEKLANWKQDADVVVMGHNHQNNIRKRVVYTGWPPRMHEQTLVTTGTFVDGESYAMEMGLAPSWVGAPLIRLGGNSMTGIPSVRASLG